MESSQTTVPPKRRRFWRRPWRRAVQLAVLAALLGVLAAALAPLILPDTVVRAEVAKALSARLGRPVTVEWAWFSWHRGLRAGGIEIKAGPGAADPDAPLAKIKRLAVRFHPLDVPGAALGMDAPIESLRFDEPEVWVALDEMDRFRSPTEDGRAAPPPEIETIQITDGTFHVENHQTGRSVVLRHVAATVGQLTTNGRGYVNLTAELPGDEQAGRLAVTASLSSLGLAQPERLSGSLKVEWERVNWPETLAAVLAEPYLVNSVGLTTGRLSATFGRDQWNVEGAVEANNLVLGDPRAKGDEAAPLRLVAFDRAVLGFQMRRTDSRKPIDLDLVRFSARGVNLQLSGTVQPDGPRGPQAALRMSGVLDWAPLAESVEPLHRLAANLEELGGGADLNVNVSYGAEGLQLVGGADLAGTKVDWPDVVHKESGRPLRLDVDARVPPAAGAVPAAVRIELAGEAGRVQADCRIPCGSEKADAAALTTVDVQTTVADLESARGLYPVLGRLLGPIHATGPLDVAVSLRGPAPAAATEAAVWSFQSRTDLTQAVLTLGEAPGKAAGILLVLDGAGTLTPATGELNLEHFQVRLDQATFSWSGAGRLQRAEGDAALRGRVEGTVEVRGVESAGALLAPEQFPASAPPLAGAMTLTVRADLTGARLTGTFNADLGSSAIRALPYFDKPAGAPTSAALEGSWRMGEVNHLDGRLRVALPGGTLQLEGQGEVRLRTLSPEAPNPLATGLVAGDGSRPLRHLTVGLAPENRLQVRAEATDLERVVGLSPLLTERLQGYGVSGAATAALEVTTQAEAVRIGGDVDLTAASLQWGRLLDKSPDVPMQVAMTLDVLPPQRHDAVRLQLDRFEARLGDSVTQATGWVELEPPASLSGVGSVGQVLAMLSEARLSVKSRLDHGALLRRTLPWLEPLYERCAIEGPTRLAADFSGTAIRGDVRFGLDATDCRFLEPGSLAKPAGTPASVVLEAHYGDVPGEVVIKQLEMKLADAETRASGRLLFDDPRVSTLAPPTAWSLQAEGRIPDVGRLASLFPARVAAFRPAGGVTFALRAAADPFGVGIGSFDLAAHDARCEWLGRAVSLDGRITYDGERLSTEGMHFVVGRSDVTVAAYIAHPDDAPTGSVLVRGRTLALDEVQDFLTEAHEQLTRIAAEGGAGQAPSLPPAAVRRLQRFLALAQISGAIELDRVTLAVPEWETTYEPTAFRGEGRLSGNRFVIPQFRCTLDEGDVAGEAVLDFRPAVPVLAYAFTARDLHMEDNLRPFIDHTFPGMQVYGTLSTTQSMTQELAEGAVPVGQGETILTDGLMVGPAAPDYVTSVFPGLALSEYRFNKMSNVFRNLKNGDVENRMIFDGRTYDVFIFGTSHPEGPNVIRTSYTLGIDLSVSLGSKVWSRDLDQGKIPLLTYTGRIVGTQYAEQNIEYVLPHQLAWDVFIRRNLVIQLVKSLGRKPPDLHRPPVGPDERPKTAP